MPFIGRIVLCVLGISLFGLEALVYEDEERQLQNRLEEWWVKLDDVHRKTSVVESALLRNLFRALNFILDAVFGPKVFSAQAALASISASLLGIWFWIVILRLVLKPPTMPGVLEITEVFWPLAAGPFLISRLGWAGVVAGVMFSAVPIYRFAEYSLAHQNVGFVLGTFFGFAVSIALDVAVLWLIRRFLDRPPVRLLTFKMLLGSVMLIACAVGLPVFILVRSGGPKLNTGNSLAVVMLLFNLSDLAAFLLFTAFAVLLVMHHTLWPSVKRALYSLQRFSIFSHRKLVCGLGIAFFLLGIGAGEPSLGAAWNILKKAVSP